MTVIPFEKFLEATGARAALDLYREIPFPNYGYERLASLFHQYCLVGGIPEMVERYAATKDISRLSSLLDRHLEQLFSMVVSLGHSRKTRNRLLQIYQDCFSYAAMRICFRGFGDKSFRSREVGNAFRVLQEHRLLRLIYPTTLTILPWEIDYNRFPRLQLPDTGLVTYYTGIREALTGQPDLSAVFNRQISLHIVGQELLSASTDPEHAFHFWVRPKTQSSAEVDFVIGFQGLMIPVEVKSGAPGRLRSLHRFVDEAPHPFAVRLYAGQLMVKEARTVSGKTYYLMSLPYFLAGKIGEHMEGFVRYVRGE
jgi:predicted AAA+ superfamily ATPase